MPLSLVRLLLDYIFTSARKLVYSPSERKTLRHCPHTIHLNFFLQLIKYCKIHLLADSKTFLIPQIYSWPTVWIPLTEVNRRPSNLPELEVNRKAQVECRNQFLNIILDWGSKSFEEFNAFKTQSCCVFSKRPGVTVQGLIQACWCWKLTKPSLVQNVVLLAMTAVTNWYSCSENVNTSPTYQHSTKFK